jgi:hypothetical protein
VHTRLLRSVDQGRPLELREKPPEKIWIEIGIPELDLYVAEGEREVVGVATPCVASEYVVCYQTNHGSRAYDIARRPVRLF